MTVDIDLTSLFPYPLDDFQLEAIEHLKQGESVVVCAPTGSGKTVIAEFAVEMSIKMGKRCFYTTPLKALSNQKFHDLKKKYGEDGVGLLTGDISINRDAPVVVMTTEVFRNMLYGTHMGDVNRNLMNVASVVLDECHYMNDAERGTVWEESIIYCPSGVQLVALSATVANAAELTAWIDQTHGPTKLVLSDFRPVPLRFYYFGNQTLYQLLHSGGGLSGQLKSLFAKKHDRFNKKARRKMEPLPDPRDVVRTLAQKDMLPAICFLFSRRGCEESMKKCGEARLNLLDNQEQQTLRRAIDELVRDNPNLKTHPHIDYLYKSVAVHHAGMLPSWKGAVEKLFQRGLIKAVFATETLAAGINMPARTTVISAISKRSDDGHRFLRASEFLQMSGRAGRRGMDEVGHVVVLRHPFEHIEDVAKLATAKADPLASRFTPSYGMVLNLLQRHNIEETKDLIEQSFGQYVMNHELEPLFEQKMAFEEELATLSGPLCPDEIGDLPLYKRRMEAHNAKNKQIKAIKRGQVGGKQSMQELGATIAALESEMKGFQDEARAMPCFECPVQKPCSKQADRVRTLNNKIKELNKIAERETGKYWRTFDSLANILRLQGYLNADTVTDLGKMAAAIRATNELFISEVILSGVLKKLQVHEFAAVLTALVTEVSRPEDVSSAKIDPSVEMVLERIAKIARKVYLLQRDFDIDIPIEFSPLFCGLSQMWANGATWEQIRLATYHDEGIVVRAFRRTVDLCRQIAVAPNSPRDIADMATHCERLMSRDEVREDY